MNIKTIDHITLTVSNLNQSLRFYHEVFDLPEITLADGRTALRLGKQQLRFQTPDELTTPTAKIRTVGSADFSIITSDPLENVLSHLSNYAVTIVDGPLETEGAHGKMTTILLEDPDQNLIRIGMY